MAIGDIISRLSVELAMNSAVFEKNAAKAGRSTKDLGDKAENLGFRMGRMGKAVLAAGATFAGGALVSGIFDMAKASLESASALGEQAAQLGVSTRALQEYRFAASQTGIEQGQMDAALAKLTKTMGEAAGGAKKPAEAFAKLGIDIKAFVASGKDAGDLLPAMAAGLGKLDTEGDKAATGAAILGRNFQTLMPLLNEGAAGINRYRKEARDLGIVLSDDLISQADEAADKMSKLQNVLKMQIAHFVAANAKEISALADDLLKLAKGALDAFNAWMKMRRAMRERDDLISRADAHLDAKKLPSGVRERAKGIARDIIDQRTGTETVADGGIFGSIKRVGVAGRVSGQAAVSAFLPLPKIVEDLVAQKPAMEALSAQAERLRKVSATLGDEWGQLADRLFPDVAALKRYRADLATINKAEKGGLSEEDAYQARRGLALEGRESNGLSDFLAGSEVPLGAMNDISGAIEGLIERTGILKRTSRDTADALGNNFEESADRVLGALDRMASAFRGGGFLDKLGGILNFGLQLGSIGAFGKGFQTNLKSSANTAINSIPILKLPGYATGTHSASRGLALVGERGPELVDFQGGERVFNSRESSRMGGTVININAKDAVLTQQVRQWVAEGMAMATHQSVSMVETRSTRRQQRRLG